MSKSEETADSFPLLAPLVRKAAHVKQSQCGTLTYMKAEHYLGEKGAERF